LKKAEGPEGWILLDKIYNFAKIKRFRGRVPRLEDFFEVVKLSTVVEVKAETLDWGVEKEKTFYIRKKVQTMMSEFESVFGCNIDTVK